MPAGDPNGGTAEDVMLKAFGCIAALGLGVIAAVALIIGLLVGKLS